jgi:peroxiredoxin
MGESSSGKREQAAARQARPLRIWLLVGGALGGAVLAAVLVDRFLLQPPPPPPATAWAPYHYGSAYDEEPMAFKDDATTNTQVADSALELTFVDSSGRKVDLGEFRGRKNVVLVVTRGFAGYVCPHCTTQTSRLISNHAEFARRDAEVLVVFPGPRGHLDEFVKASQHKAHLSSSTAVPFAVLLDEDLQAVGRLGIRADLAKPSTYILDKQGHVRFAYVGTTSTDRPSMQSLLHQLDLLGKK